MLRRNDGEQPVETILTGESSESIALFLEPAKLPRLVVTDENGVTRFLTVGLAELLGVLDRSAVLESLEQSHIRTELTPELPERTLFAGIRETPSTREVIATGWIPPREQPFVWDERSYLVAMPVLVWRAVWCEVGQPDRRLTSLRLALTLPGTESATGETPLYRWPFSNVYSGGSYSEVCWYTMKQVEMDLKDVVRLGVEGFLSVEDNGDLFGRGRSQNSPYDDYAEFLKAAESVGLKEEWLIGHPSSLRSNRIMTVSEFHAQPKASV